MEKMYYVEDEATGGIIENNPDLDDAILTAKELAKKAAPYGCYIVTDENDEVLFRTSEDSYKFYENKQTVKLTENDLKNIVAESVKRILKEDDFGDIKHWYDETEETYDMIAMIKSDMNPIQHSFKATSLQDALRQAMEYFTGFTRNGEKDVDIFYIKHHGYDGI